MSGLLTQVIRRQALMMMPRRYESALYIAGPPAVKVTNKVKQMNIRFGFILFNSSRKN